MTILENASLRQQLCKDENLWVLSKVGELNTLSGQGWAMTQDVVNFYQVSSQAIRNLVFDHRDELASDGYQSLTAKQFREMFPQHNFKSKARWVAIFSRRAVLRVGMLLRDSEVAKKIRNYLLNTERYAAQEDTLQPMLKMAEHMLRHADVLAQNTAEIQAHAKVIVALVNELQQHKQRISLLEGTVVSHDERLLSLENMAARASHPTGRRGKKTNSAG